MAVDYRDLLKRLGKNPQHKEQVASGNAIMDHLLSKHAQRISPNSPVLSAREIANTLGEEVHYGDTYKFLSKFAHPTSMSIQLRGVEAITKGIVIPNILEMALRLVADAFPRLAGRIREISVHP